MNRLFLVSTAALALTIFQPDDASAQHGGVRASGSSGFRGATMTGAYRGIGIGVGHRGAAIGAGHPGVAMGAGHHGTAIAMHGAATRGRPWRMGWGWQRGLPVAIGIAAGTWGYDNEPSDDQCLFLTHHGWINTCF